jgi:type VI secretion system secreted protein Hcp
MVEENKEVDYFLKIEGIDGESQDAKHPDEIRIEHFTLNVVNRGRRGDYGVGKPVHDDAYFIADVDQSYPKMRLAAATGETIPKAVLTSRKAGKYQQDYLRITFTDVLVTSCKIESGEKEVPLMEFTLSFVKKQIEYKEQKQDGSLGGAMTAMVDLHGKRSGA